MYAFFMSTLEVVQIRKQLVSIYSEQLGCGGKEYTGQIDIFVFILHRLVDLLGSVN